MIPLPPELRAALERAQHAGMLGPEDVERQVAHALEFLRPFEVLPGATYVDLGSGGGVPGLPLALAYPQTRWVLLDAWQARCAHLARAIQDLGLEDRVQIVHGRAEDIGRGALRETAAIVVSRSFGRPAFTAECAAPLLRRGGRLVVSVGSDALWPETIPQLGLTTEQAWTTARGAFRALRRTGGLGSQFPRRPAAQRRAPLF